VPPWNCDDPEWWRDFTCLQWAATSKGWIAKPGGPGLFRGYWIKLIGNMLVFTYQQPYKYTYSLTSAELGELLRHIVFNNSHNIKRVKQLDE